MLSRRQANGITPVAPGDRGVIGPNGVDVHVVKRYISVVIVDDSRNQLRERVSASHGVFRRPTMDDFVAVNPRQGRCGT